MKYDLSKLFRKAWSLYRKAAKKAAITFSEALKTAWMWIKAQAANTAKVEAAAEAAGIVEEYRTWAGWQAVGRMVIHTSEAAFKVEVDDPSTRKGTRILSYFIYPQPCFCSSSRKRGIRGIQIRPAHARRDTRIGYRAAGEAGTSSVQICQPVGQGNEGLHFLYAEQR